MIKRMIFRLFFYLLGLLLLALGVAFSVNSGLGVSPTNSLPYAVSAVSGVTMGACVTLVFCCYILLQILLLRRRFKPVNLLQIVFSSLFGVFVDFAKGLLGSFTLPGYAGRLGMLAASIFIVAVGLVFYLSAELIPMPMEGLALAVHQKLLAKMQFHQVKIVVDSLSVLSALLVTLLGTGAVDGVREGTVISALLIGKA
ncbi:MAG: DUF6198 family protein, partial [Oscillospiraceae bacterium]|nr:DUF6198 family protein [Oscillospiraceae bacterium]